jgi:hypothetical protein
VRARLRYLTQNRQGTIKVRVAGDRHCGTIVNDGQVSVQYNIHLVVGPNDLDDRDFLVDQEALHNFMVMLGSEPVSWREPCELLAIVWGDKLEEWVRTTNTRCSIHELSLTLSPAPNAGSFTATFVAQQHANSVALRAVP